MGIIDKYPKAAALQRLLSFPSNGIDFIQKPEKRNTPLFTEKVLSPNQKNMRFLLNPEAQSYKIAIDFGERSLPSPRFQVSHLFPENTWVFGGPANAKS